MKGKEKKRKEEKSKENERKEKRKKKMRNEILYQKKMSYDLSFCDKTNFCENKVIENVCE